MPERHLFVSPHYDDTVYSCGATMHTLAQSGAEVLNLTVMAGIPQPPFPDTPVLKDNLTRWQAGEHPMQTRRSEDQNAAAILGADTLYMPCLDCLYRTHPQTNEALYPTEESLWQAAHSADPVPAQIAAFPLNLAGFRRVYAPLSAGNHIDHQILREQARAWQKAGVAVWWYADYPYMRQPQRVQQALNSFQGEALQMIDVVFEEPVMRVKVKAMRAYATQISSFWESDRAIDEEVRQTFRDDVPGRYRERFWRVQPAMPAPGTERNLR
jgi:LmbE family N-acetylglucosaminyl deacetylase